jgi:pimeloyl-ACP methyl ester carboxylesterase
VWYGVFFAALVVVFAAGWLYAPDQSRTDLEAQYGGPPSEFLPVLGVRLHVRDTGPKTAPAVILLHGLGSSLHTWEDWAQALSGRFRVIRYDLPGFGLTGADPSGDYSDTRGKAVLAALMDRLGIRRACVVGNSLGGKLAWKFASAYPDRAEKLVLISPDGFASPGFAYDEPAKVPALARLLPYTLPRFMMKMNLVPAYGDAARLTDTVIDRYRDLMLAPGVRRALLARTSQVRLERPDALLGRIEAPTLLVWGEKDRLIPLRNAQKYLKAIHASRLVTFPDLGHVPQEEAPAGSLPPVAAFLAEPAP